MRVMTMYITDKRLIKSWRFVTTQMDVQILLRLIALMVDATRVVLIRGIVKAI
jgi:hypothetical protein